MRWGARQVEVFSVPMSIRFRRIEHREGVLVHGPAGIGEFSPFWDYGVEESASWLAAAFEAADEISPPPVRDLVPVNCTVPAVDAERATAIVTAPHGCRTAKVKVAEPGQTLEDDVARVAAVRAALGAAGRIRVDANGAWSVDEAVLALRELASYDLEYAEQPTASVEELAEVRRRVDVPIAADESIRRAQDPVRVKRCGAADIAVLKVQPLGGVRACLRLAEQIDMPVVVSSALETSVGIAAGVRLAAALPELPYACGLATASMLRADVVADSLVPVAGAIRVVRAVALDADLVGAVRSDDDTTRRWRERFAACQQVLQSRPR
ncbi:MAG: o-succinylbenzoate synthase [Nocardioidaceae bacterium]